jgi:hypothetical protein
LWRTRAIVLFDESSFGSHSSSPELVRFLGAYKATHDAFAPTPHEETVNYVLNLGVNSAMQSLCERGFFVLILLCRGIYLLHNVLPRRCRCLIYDRREDRHRDGIADRACRQEADQLYLRSARPPSSALPGSRENRGPMIIRAQNYGPVLL